MKEELKSIFPWKDKSELTPLVSAISAVNENFNLDKSAAGHNRKFNLLNINLSFTETFSPSKLIVGAIPFFLTADAKPFENIKLLSKIYFQYL